MRGMEGCAGVREGRAEVKRAGQGCGEPGRDEGGLSRGGSSGAGMGQEEGSRALDLPRDVDRYLGAGTPGPRATCLGPRSRQGPEPRVSTQLCTGGEREQGRGKNLEPGISPSTT